MNKFLKVVSYAQNENGDFITKKKDYEIISLVDVVRLCVIYDDNSYKLIIEFEDDQYEYPLSDSIPDREIDVIITQLTDFIEDTRMTSWLDLTKYQR